MRNQLIKITVFALFTFLLNACSFFDKDNTPAPSPLPDFKPEFQPQRVFSVGTASGSGDEYLKMSPAFSESSVFTASSSGVVTAVNKMNGRILWQKNTGLSLLAGPGAGDGIVVIASSKGQVMALQESTGQSLWQTRVPGEVMGSPAVNRATVLVKTVDGYLRAFAVNDGHSLWAFQQVEPNLILRGASTPLIRDNSAIVGFANGNLVKLGIHDGQLDWVQPVAIAEGAFAIQRMIDIDANPIVFEHRLYAATYQGKISSLDWNTGRIRWSHDISSYTGMTADNNSVYISDAKSHIWAFTHDGGLVNWRQTRLANRVVSGPASTGNYIVVGDAQGYVHWLDKRDGHFAARESVGSAVYASPVADHTFLYVLTHNGNLIAYRLNS